MKISLNARARIVAEEYLKNVSFSDTSVHECFINVISFNSFKLLSGNRL